MKRWPFLLATAMMAATWAFVASRTGAEPSLARRPFAEFPLTLGAWVGHDLGMDAQVLDLLKLSDYLMREYRPSAALAGDDGALEGRVRQSAAPVFLYVGYYASQRTGATYHSPKNCLPGSGWQFASSDTVAGLLPGRPRASVNRVVIEKGFDRQMILYWYQDRGRVVASEYAAKGYLVWDAMTRNRTDGALVRISTPIVGTQAEAFQRAASFLAAAWAPLQAHLPS